MGKLAPKNIKILKTVNLYLCFFTLGLSMAVPGPCLLDLEKIVNTDTQHMAFIYTARSTGYLIGSGLGGVLLDSIKYKQAVLILSNFFLALSMLAIPWSRNISTLMAFMVIKGLALGTVDTGGNVVCLTLWGSDSGPFFQALHLTYGVGSLVAPLIAAPFLDDYNEEIQVATGDNTTYSNFTTDFTNSSTEFLNYNRSDSSDGPSNVIYPFSFIGVFGLLVTIMSLAVYIISPVEEKKSRNTTSKYNKTSSRFLFSVVFLNFLLLFVETGIEMGYSQMLTTYVVKGRLQLATSEGSYMTSAFWAAYAISRLASVFLAIKVSNFSLIVYNVAITLLGSLILLFLASYEWAMWLASVLLGVGVAPIFPASVACLDSYISVTNKIASIFVVGVSLGGMIMPFTISYFIETIPDVLIYLVPASCISSSLIVFILYLILRKRQEKY